MARFSTAVIRLSQLRKNWNVDLRWSGRIVEGVARVAVVASLCSIAQPANAQVPIVSFALEKVQCPTILDSATRARLFTGNIPQTPAEPNDHLDTLAVRINTGSGIMAGTDDEVWLDVGPKAWKIGSSFPAGSSQTFLVDVTTPDPAIDIPAIPPLRVKDIAIVRLEKKGICGLTNAPDSKYALTSTDLSAEGFVKQLQKQVDLAQYALQLKQTTLAKAQEALDKADTALRSAENEIRNASKLVEELPQQIANLATEIEKKKTELALLPLTVAHEVCNQVRQAKPGVDLKTLACILNPAPCFILVTVCKTEQIANPKIQELRNAINGIDKSKNDFAARLAANQIKIATLATAIAPLTAARTAAKAQLDLIRAEQVAAQKALELVKVALEEGRKLAAKLPGIELPRIGQWSVESIVLIVNGHEMHKFTPNVTLRQGRPEWVVPVRAMSTEELFLRRLRMTLNRGNDGDHRSLDQILAGPLTAFKVAGFSGWLRSDVPRGLVIGTLRNRPSPGTDGVVSLDLELERVEVGRWAYGIGKSSEYGTRYVRVEYAFAAGGRNDRRFDNWNVNDRIEATGDIQWDTDRNGFFEVHPAKPENLRKLAPGETGGTSLVQRLFRPTR